MIDFSMYSSVLKISYFTRVWKSCTGSLSSEILKRRYINYDDFKNNGGCFIKLARLKVTNYFWRDVLIVHTITCPTVIVILAVRTFSFVNQFRTVV